MTTLFSKEPFAASFGKNPIKKNQIKFIKSVRVNNFFKRILPFFIEFPELLLKIIMYFFNRNILKNISNFKIIIFSFIITMRILDI